MAGATQAGPICGYNNPVVVDDGTLCRAQSQNPGLVSSGIGTSFASFAGSVESEWQAAKATAGTAYGSVQHGIRSDYEGGRCIYRAYKRAEELAPAAILAETGYQLESLLKGLLPGLLQMMVIMAATTLLGAAVGGIVGFFCGGAGAAPGAVVGGELGFDAGMAVLTWLGVAFLAGAMIQGFGEMMAALRSGIEGAWQARNLEGRAQQMQVERAAQQLARTIGILMRLILQGILAYLLKKTAVNATRGAMTTARMAQAGGAGAVSDATVAELVGKLRASKFGDGFANWVERNWRDLQKNKLLQPKQEGQAGVGAAAGGGEGGAADEPGPAPRESAASDDAEEEKPDLSSNAKKGVFGEANADAYMKQKGFKKLNGADVKVGDSPRGQGIDGVYENRNPPPKYVIAEAKFGSSQLGKTKDGMQMSENWIDNRLEKAVGRKTADDIQLEGYDRWLLKVDESGKVTPKIINEDAAGKITLSDPPAGSSP